MKVLLVTGKLAYESVKEIASQLKDVKADVIALNYPIASLMTVDYIAENLKNISLKDYDYIIIPGLASGDAQKIQEVTKVKTYKGSEDYRDIPRVIEALSKGETLSTIYPADTILKKKKEEDIEKILRELEEKGDFAFEIDGLKIPRYPPPFRIFIEFDASKDIEFLLGEAKRVSNYVNVIVLGFPNGHEDLDEVRKKVTKFREEGYIVGIDSASTKELIEGAKAGADFIFNLNEDNINELAVIKDKAFVVAPLSIENRANVTFNLYRKAKEIGFEKLILDPILSPPMVGLVDSIFEYKKLRDLTDAPMLMGILNVTELIDVDSIGVNALLTAIAGELKIGNLLIMEHGKTRWSSYEVNIATKMISVSLHKKSLPKDLGLDLLILKDKKRIKEKIRNPEDYLFINEHIEPKNMDKGFVVIKVADKIYLEWKGKENIKISGTDGLSIGRKLIELKKDINNEHSLYIGYELAKAELAFKLDKNYIQDEPLFVRGYNIIDSNNNTTKKK
ncbi:dihydropteroate synthase-like protein [Sulfurisphaera ohwakuensis]|uniref:Dihydropteroate synthase-like protein n=1 Tax=Sulfurisphaera ohwakuensis TaxID=69656 RepID=A0A650CEK0_SULOH|nr:dihydropteroate synthase-like protein [Sulfurisphaera ohwakuensis]MBB5252865.1 dihydropteroate synthase-like protein [Sulfurisphaera ohwakuensis]QGR16202.1 dihydropteroate synthase-like protein [Sulfurisphaera ohwakuensis]